MAQVKLRTIKADKPTTFNKRHSANFSNNIRHRTVTLDGVHDKNKALYRLGVSADEIHRDKALKTMGGSENTYQLTLQ